VEAAAAVLVQPLMETTVLVVLVAALERLLLLAAALVEMLAAQVAPEVRQAAAQAELIAAVLATATEQVEQAKSSLPTVRAAAAALSGRPADPTSTTTRGMSASGLRVRQLSWKSMALLVGESRIRAVNSSTARLTARLVMARQMILRPFSLASMLCQQRAASLSFQRASTKSPQHSRLEMAPAPQDQLATTLHLPVLVVAQQMRSFFLQAAENGVQPTCFGMALPLE